MSWPAWPSFEFPPKELPVFLHPLRLIPYYKDRIGNTLTSFLKRDDNRLFGPVEKAVTAIVVIGLALQSGQTPINDDTARVSSSKSGAVPHNDTSPSVSPHSPAYLSNLVSPGHQTGSTTVDLLLGLVVWLKDHLNMSAVLVILLTLNAGLMMLSSELKTRLKTSWDLFWPPWQDRSSGAHPEKTPHSVPSPEHDSKPTEDKQTAGSGTRPDVPIAKEDRSAAKTPQTATSKVAKKADEAITPSSTLTKGKERMEGERPTEKGSQIVDPDKPVKDKAGVLPTAEEDEIKKQLDKVRGRMVDIKQDSTLDDSAKTAKLKELEKVKEKLKGRLSTSPSADVTPSAKTQSDPAMAHKPSTSTPDNGTADQLAKLNKKTKAIQDDDSMNETQKASQLKEIEAMRQGLKAKSAVTTPEPTSCPAESSTPLKTPKSLLADRSAHAMTPDDQKQLEKLKAKMMVVKADTTLSDSDKAAKLSQLDKARQQLIQRAEGSQQITTKEEKPPASAEPANPKTVSTTSEPAAALSPEMQKQLERLKGKMAAVKADKALTESERVTKLRELDKARQDLRIGQLQAGDAQGHQAKAESPHSPFPDLSTQKSSKSASTKSSGKSDTDTDTGDDTARSGMSDDPLLSGESRQLKSALKKSKKKPRQKKNIHHNYFMTMRGWRPALMPFPHGLHPKPEHPRHTLWWDNVPKDADHIMASPKIAKVPEGLRPGEDESGNEGKKEKKDDKASSEEGKKVLEKVDKKIPPAAPEASSKKRSAGGSGGGQASEGERLSNALTDDKTEEGTKLKAAAKAKEQAKEQEEAKTKVKANERPSMSKGASSVPSVQAPPMVDLQVQKATWVTQGMLCALIWFVHEQLALVLLGFFIWQHMQDSKARTVAVTAAQAKTTEATERKPSTIAPTMEPSLATSGFRKLPSKEEKTDSEPRSAPKEGAVQPLDNPARTSARPRDPSEPKPDTARKAKSVSSKADTNRQPLTSVPSPGEKKTLRSPDSHTDAHAQDAGKIAGPSQSVKDLRGDAESSKIDKPKSSSSSDPSGKGPVASSIPHQSGKSVAKEQKPLSPISKEGDFDPNRKVPMAALHERRMSKSSGSPVPLKNGGTQDGSPNVDRQDGKQGVCTGAKEIIASGERARSRNPAVSDELLTVNERMAEPERQGSSDQKAESRSQRSGRRDPGRKDDVEDKAIKGNQSASIPAEYKSDEPTKQKSVRQVNTGTSGSAKLTPEMLKKLERVPLNKREKYARMMMVEARRQAEDRPRSNQRTTADPESGRLCTNQAETAEAAESEQSTVDGEMTAEAGPKRRAPGYDPEGDRGNRQDRANTDDRIFPCNGIVGPEGKVTEYDGARTDDPQPSARAEKGDRRAFERAKAARREQRLRESQREAEMQNPLAEKSSSSDLNIVSGGSASLLSHSGKSRRGDSTEMSADVAKDRDSRLRQRIETTESKRRPEAASSLLITDEEGADGTYRFDKPTAGLDDQTYDIGTGRREDVEKLQEARRAKLLAKIPPVQTPPNAEDHDHEAEEVSPVSVYSQVTEAPSPKASHRLTRDVVAVRDALLADAPANLRHRRSSSTGSLEVIRFDGANIPGGPRTAPIVSEFHRPNEIHVGDSPDLERMTSTRGYRKKNDRAETTGKDDEAASSESIFTGRIEDPAAMARDKGKARSDSSKDSARDLRLNEKVVRATKDKAKRAKPTRPAGERSGSPEWRPRDDSKDSSEKEKRARPAAAGERSSRDHAKKTKPDGKLKLEDLTPEQVEKMQKARERGRLEKARAAKQALGQGSSGLSGKEKASLPSP